MYPIQSHNFIAQNVLKELPKNLFSQAVQGNKLVWVVATLALAIFGICAVSFKAYRNRIIKGGGVSFVEPDYSDLAHVKIINSMDALLKTKGSSSKNDPILNGESNTPSDDLLDEDELDYNVIHRSKSDMYGEVQMEIIKLRSEVEEENEVLKLTTDTSDILATEQRIEDLKSKLNLALKIFAKKDLKLNRQSNIENPIDKLIISFFSPLLDQSNHFRHDINHSVMAKSINSLNNFIVQNENNEDELVKIFRGIDEFFNHTVFYPLKGKMNFLLDENHKKRYESFEALFPVIDKYICLIWKKDQELATRLQIKFANLPCSNREKFPELFLTEKKQLIILIDHFQKKEDLKIDELLLNMKNIREENVNIIAKMASFDQSRLSKKNCLRLQNTLKKILGLKSPDNWGQYSTVHASLKNYFTHISQTKENKGKDWGFEKTVEKLWRMTISKQFFLNQIDKKENEIQIPKWYHITKHNSYEDFFSQIIGLGEVSVLHKGTHKGAWVSNRPEVGEYGESGFGFSHRIEKIDPKARICTRNKFGVRWRGSQKPLPFIKSSFYHISNPEIYLSMIGIRPGKDLKKLKLKIIKELEKKNIKNPTIFSMPQVQYIHKNIFKAIGCPNLSNQLW